MRLSDLAGIEQGENIQQPRHALRQLQRRSELHELLGAVLPPRTLGTHEQGRNLGREQRDCRGEALDLRRNIDGAAAVLQEPSGTTIKQAPGQTE